MMDRPTYRILTTPPDTEAPRPEPVLDDAGGFIVGPTLD